MNSPYQKHELWVAIVGGFFILAIIITLISYSRGRTEALKQEFETPSLIQMAYDRHQITNEQRLLYLAYALMEPESLPAPYRSRVGWFGEMAQYELDDLNDPEVFCSMSPYARNEFQRLLKINMTCERQIWRSVLVGILIVTIITLVVRIQNKRLTLSNN